MEIRQFTYVNMVAECGSMTKAAAKLFITQPALSNYISKRNWGQNCLIVLLHL